MSWHLTHRLNLRSESPRREEGKGGSKEAEHSGGGRGEKEASYWRGW